MNSTGLQITHTHTVICSSCFSHSLFHMANLTIHQQMQLKQLQTYQQMHFCCHLPPFVSIERNVSFVTLKGRPLQLKSLHIYERLLRKRSNSACVNRMKENVNIAYTTLKTNNKQILNIHKTAGQFHTQKRQQHNALTVHRVQQYRQQLGNTFCVVLIDIKIQGIV